MHCLKLPQFHLQNVRNILYSKISERKGGIRLEHEIINGKHFFHNYGHGGAGVSLAYGSAFISSKSLTVFMDINSHIECGVIGAGISGLMTAV